MQYDFIAKQSDLLNYCEGLAGASAIAFDTEFVSEDTYRPELCLVQVAAAGKYAVIDPFPLDDLTPFWKVLTEGDHETIVHAGREEFRFCRLATQGRPRNWFDIQIAAALIGLEYPASYSTLLSKLLGKSLAKHETRTDWRRRPLSKAQLQYALEDVVYLEQLRDKLAAKINQLGRQSWLEDELGNWQTQLETTESQEQWRRVSGINSLRPRSLAVVRELWRWRDKEAERRDRPPKRLLRDDLIVELARRQSSDIKKIRAIRGLERRDLQKYLDAFSETIARALDLPDDQCPRPPARRHRPQFNVLGQFFNAALGNVCRAANVAPSIVGTTQDVRDLLAYHTGVADKTTEPPSLARGWRAEVLGSVMTDLLDGKVAIGVTDPLSEDPLALVKVSEADDEQP